MVMGQGGGAVALPVMPHGVKGAGFNPRFVMGDCARAMPLLRPKNKRPLSVDRDNERRYFYNRVVFI